MSNKENKFNLTEKKISFGKIKNKEHTFYNLEVFVMFRIIDNEIYISAGMWNYRRKDYDCCGQCLNDLIDYFREINNIKFIEIFEIWKQYHMKTITQDIINKVLSW